MSHYRAVDRQLDHTLLNSEVFTIPKSAAGRFTRKDTIRFYWPPSINPDDYTVVVEALDADVPFRSIGILATVLELPLVQFGPYARLCVVPATYDRPAFYGTLMRGGTYIVPDTGGAAGRFKLVEFGKMGQ